MAVILRQGELVQQFYRSGPMPCPYLAGRVERKLFTRMPEGAGGAELNSRLSRAGFRRSHDILYRPSCPDCSACVPVRVPVPAFCATRSQRRVLRRNSDLKLCWAPAVATPEQYILFNDYQQARHGDGDMALMTALDFAAMVGDGAASAALLEARGEDGRLVGAMLTDRLTDGYSAVYSFYAPAEPRRSLGTFLVLALLEYCQAMGVPFLYLGYWVQGSRKMSYKGRFRPLEALAGEGWRRVPDEVSGDDAATRFLFPGLNTGTP